MSTRAHTVPRFYLNGFAASEPNREPFVWVASLKTSEIKRRSPKNLSIARGQYDGQGGFSYPGSTIEDHLAKIEGAASAAIRKLGAIAPGTTLAIPPEICRFLAWQAARTPGWMRIVEQWVNSPTFSGKFDPVEPPPEGFDDIRSRPRALLLEDPRTGSRREFVEPGEIDTHRKAGWKVVLRRDDHLEMTHLQAWYFQVRHFPRPRGGLAG